eukprot:10213453-Karenia_brevis.AAC.1
MPVARQRGAAQLGQSLGHMACWIQTLRKTRYLTQSHRLPVSDAAVHDEDAEACADALPENPDKEEEYEDD